MDGWISKVMLMLMLNFERFFISCQYELLGSDTRDYSQRVEKSAVGGYYRIRQALFFPRRTCYAAYRRYTSYACNGHTRLY